MLDVRAKPVLQVNALIRDDLPTLERPAKAISGVPRGGRNSIDGTPRTNVHAPRAVRARQTLEVGGVGAFKEVSAYSAGSAFFLKIALRLSHKAISAPLRFMM